MSRTGPGAPASRRVPIALLGLALLGVQLLWVLALPAYYGLDEFDHAYRASSVADGHWGPGTVTPEDGNGYLVRVPADIVSAAHEACAGLSYTRPDNCNPVTAPDEDGTVLVASTAATYNPVWYAVVGTLAKPFSGDAAVIAMRVVGIVLCDVLLLAAAAIALRTGRSVWPFIGVILVATPILLYSTTVAAPNGVGYSAGVLMWVAGLRILSDPDRAERRHLVALTLAVMTVIVTHTTGAMWVLLVLATTAPLWWGRARSLVVRDRRSWVAAGAVVLLTGLACAAWILAAHTNDPSRSAAHAGRMPVSQLVTSPVIWTFQAIATLRFRDEPAPLAVYGLGFTLLVVLTAAALRRGAPRHLAAAGLVAGATLVVPLALTYATYDAIGSAWQGRYGLPLSVGFVLVATDALRSRAAPPPWVVWTLLGTMTVLQTATVLATFRDVRTDGLHDPVVLVVAVGLGYLAALGLAVRVAGRVRTGDGQSAPADAGTVTGAP